MSGTNPFENCTAVTPQCPVEATVYTWRPNLGANVFFLVIFALCGLIQLGQGIKWKTWTWMIALVLGCISQVIGYIGRLMLNSNPWSNTGFIIQISLLIIAPAFTAAGIYLTLKHFVLTFGAQYSYIKPALYTYIFIGADLLSLVLQGAGGGISASTNSASTAKLGTDIALAGIIWQVISLVFFAVTSVLYVVRIYRHRAELAPETIALANSMRFHLFIGSIVLAYLTILVRCCYRVPELSGGWRNSVMLNELDFIVLDGVMMAIATLALTICHPGYFFPQLSKAFFSKNTMVEKSVSSEESLA